ncbi:hypothetical protein MJT46_006102 [Ovis ammon polii x Ovis aries]|nr:hypothetical protein MJT46_006102 [Ovis ammon polii x Ovis aries]
MYGKGLLNVLGYPERNEDKKRSQLALQTNRGDMELIGPCKDPLETTTIHEALQSNGFIFSINELLEKNGNVKTSYKISHMCNKGPPKHWNKSLIFCQIAFFCSPHVYFLSTSNSVNPEVKLLRTAPQDHLRRRQQNGTTDTRTFERNLYERKREW